MATDEEEPIPTEPGMYTSLAATRVHSPPSPSVESQPCFPTHMSKCLRQPDVHTRAILDYLALYDPCLLGTLTPSSQGPTYLLCTGEFMLYTGDLTQGISLSVSRHREEKQFQGNLKTGRGDTHNATGPVASLPTAYGKHSKNWFTL